MKFPAKNTLHVLPKGCQEPHNEGYNEAHIEIYVLPVIPLGQPPHMENKRNNIWKLRILLRFTLLELISGKLQCS